VLRSHPRLCHTGDQTPQTTTSPKKTGVGEFLLAIGEDKISPTENFMSTENLLKSLNPEDV